MSCKNKTYIMKSVGINIKGVEDGALLVQKHVLYEKLSCLRIVGFR